jgi:hypothetical protein
MSSHYVVIGNEISDYLAKKGTKFSQISACKLTFHSAKLKIKDAFNLNSQNTSPFKASISPGAK